MAVAYSVYLNNYWFDELHDAATYNDRPEPYRRHERSLWTLYQVLSTGRHRAVLVAAQEQLAVHLADGSAVLAWVRATYPDCAAQLTAPVYTNFPHPADKL